jgi:hypothetical protein
MLLGSGAASAEVQEEGRKSTTPVSPRLAPQLSPNSKTNLVGLHLDLCFYFLCLQVRNGVSIYRRRLGRVEDLPLFPAPKPTPTAL